MTQIENGETFALIHYLLGDRIIAFNPALARIAGSNNAGLMLSQLMYWTRRSTLDGGWVYKSMRDWEEEINLSRYEQETARRDLLSRGLIEVMLRGIPATLHFRVVPDAIVKALRSLASGQCAPRRGSRGGRRPSGLSIAETIETSQFVENQQTSLGETSKLECAKPTNLLGENQQTNSETPISPPNPTNKKGVGFGGVEQVLTHTAPTSTERSRPNWALVSVGSRGEGKEEIRATEPNPTAPVGIEDWTTQLDRLNEAALSGTADHGATLLLAQKMLTSLTNGQFKSFTTGGKRALKSATTAEILAACTQLRSDAQDGRLGKINNPAALFVSFLPTAKTKTPAKNARKGASNATGDTSLEERVKALPKGVKPQDVETFFQVVDGRTPLNEEDPIFVLTYSSGNGIERIKHQLVFFVAKGKHPHTGAPGIFYTDKLGNFADPASMKVEFWGVGECDRWMGRLR